MSWPTCKYDDCGGIQAKGFDLCLAHLAPDQLDEFLATLKPGTHLDARGTKISTDLLARLMEAVRERPIARFGRVDFTAAELEIEEFGYLVADAIILDRARFTRWVQIDISVDLISCEGTRFDEGVLLLALKAADFSGATFGSRSKIIGAKVVSLQGTDVSNLTLVDVDLRECAFFGAHGLDQLRLEGSCRFGNPVGRWRSQRRMLAEETYVRPEFVAGTYRSLRMALEDSKNEAGAGDFYYGEMEMRRRSPETPLSERLIITAYWLLSGYGQLAWRAVAAIGVLVATVFVLLMTVGLPGEAAWTWARVDQSARIAMGAVVFREAGQQLTSAGNWTVMIARFLGPLLLILAALAVRARVKR